LAFGMYSSRRIMHGILKPSLTTVQSMQAMTEESDDTLVSHITSETDATVVKPRFDNDSTVLKTDATAISNMDPQALRRTGTGSVPQASGSHTIGIGSVINNRF